MKYKNGLLLILFLGCLVSPRYLGVNDSIFPQRLQPEPDMELQQYKIFVKFGDIVGESMQKDHNGWCVAEAFGHEVVFSKTKEETEGLLQSAMIPFSMQKDHNGWCVAEAFGHEVVFSKTKEETEGLLQSAMIPFEIIKSIDL